jgi:hypothetical protein
MHVFGSTCYAFVQNAKKLDDRSRKGVFVGYDKSSPAYLVYHPETNTVKKVRCVKFFDKFVAEAPNDDQDDSIVPNREHTEPMKDTSEQIDENVESTAEVEHSEPRYPTRTRNKPTYLDEYIIDDNVNHTVDYCFRAVDIPKCYTQAIKSPEANKWQIAMDAEVSALKDYNTFQLVPLPKDRQIVGGRWVYAVKIGQNGEETHKARFVAKGYSQVPELDYQGTFAPTARMSSIRTLLQRVVQDDMIIHQMDVKTAYLNAPIECELYMEQPEGFEKRGKKGEKLVCKLNKSLYGLKQSGRNWNNILHEYLQKEGFTQSQADPCVYVRMIDLKRCVILIVWVDDIIIAASHSELLTTVKESLGKRFKMKDLGELSWFLGTEFKCKESCIEMNQKQYIEKILLKFGMADCKPKPTPCVLGIEKVSEEESPVLEDPGEYRAMWGA